MVNPVRKLITYNNITNHVRNSYTRLSQILVAILTNNMYVRRHDPKQEPICSN